VRSEPIPSLSSASVARLVERSVRRDGDAEPELREELERYMRRSAGRFAISLGLVEQLGTGAGDRVLELGGEPWLFTQLLLERGIDVTGVSLRPGEPGGRAEVEISWDGRLGVVEQRMFDVERDRWPFADASVSHVLCMEILEHLGMSPAHMLHEANRVLVPGGGLLLTTPNSLAAWKAAHLVRGRTVQAPYSGYGPYGRHNREFTPLEVRRVLAEANFDVAVMTANIAGYEAGDRLGRLVQRIAALPGRRTAARRDHIFALARKAGPPRLAFPGDLYTNIDRERMRAQGVLLADEP
jgi:SAM-dependent methyltransferase